MSAKARQVRADIFAVQIEAHCAIHVRTVSFCIRFLQPVQDLAPRMPIHVSCPDRNYGKLWTYSSQ
jgi:hypothetical protein